MNFTWLRCTKVTLAILQVIVLSMILISIITTNWIEKSTSLGPYHEGLWQSCVMDTCLKLNEDGSPLKIGKICFYHILSCQIK